MSYDFSFLGNEWNEIKEKIKESQIILKYDSREAIYTSMQVCTKVLIKVLEIEKIEKPGSLQLSIQTLRQRNIIDESLNIKFRDIYEEYVILKREPNTKINTRVSERCIANIYDILKWYSNKYDTIASQYNLDFLNNYRDIKAELMDVRSILFYDTMNLQHKYNDVARKCRVVIEGIVRKVQIKSHIEKRGDLNSDIISIEPIMGSAAIPILQKIRRDGNGAIHINDNGKVNVVKKEEAVKIFEDTYNLARVFSIYMDMQQLKKAYSTSSSQNKSNPVKKPSDKNKSDIQKIEQNTIKIYKGAWKDLGYYEGETKNNLRHGKGKLIYKDGAIYEGKWIDDKKNDEFTITKPGVGIYKGKYKNDEVFGNWMLTKLDNTKVQVKIKDGKFIEINPNTSSNQDKNKQNNINKEPEVNNSNKFSGNWKNEGYYEGSIKNNLRHGKGKFIYANGDVHEGKWTNDKRNGKGCLTKKDKVVEQGIWQNDKKNGEFKIMHPLKGVYTGEFKNDKYIGPWILTRPDNKKVQVKVRNGEFIEIIPNISSNQDKNKQNNTNKEPEINNPNMFSGNWKNEGYYEGKIKDNLRDGKGKFIYANGDIHEGKWRNDKRNGKGCLTKKDKVVEQGIWQNDKKHGEFKIIHPLKGIYTGEFKDDKYVGPWILTRPDNKKVQVKVRNGEFIEINHNTSSNKDKNKKNNTNKEPETNNSNMFSGNWKNEGYYEGEIKDNLRHGKGKFIYKDGSVYNGEWSHDVISGQGTMSYKNGNIYTGEWILLGEYFEGKVEYNNGEIYEGRCAYTKATKTYVRYGTGKMIYNNGYIYEGGWQNDLKHGLFEVKKSGISGIYKGRCELGKHIGEWTFVHINNMEVQVKFNGKEFVKIRCYDTKEFKNKIAKCEEKNFLKGTYKGELQRLMFKYERHGIGIMKYTNGDIYEGEWKNNKKHGQGRMKYANGTIYEGLWEYDKKL